MMSGEGKVSVILLDIEGTTTPINFVYDNLFVYARKHLEDFLKRNSGDRHILDLISELKTLRSGMVKSGEAVPDWSSTDSENEIGHAIEFCLWLMDLDSKNGTLKEIQGLIWKDGYMNGDLFGEVYPDVKPALERWTGVGLKVCIYSSGSVLGQKLLFSTTRDGDLTRYISEFFDTAVGAKVQSESYHKIAKDLNVEEHSIIFFSDRVQELDAARHAGFRTILVARDLHDKGASNQNHPVIQNFKQADIMFSV